MTHEQYATIKQINSQLFWKANFYRPSPMPCAKAYARPREEPAAGGGGFMSIAAILWQRPSSPDDGDNLGGDEKGPGDMMSKRRREVWKAKDEKYRSTDKNGVSKQGKTNGREEKSLVVWLQQASYLTHWSNTNQPCLQVNANRDLIDCEACEASPSYVKCMCVTLPWISHPLP